MLTDTKASMVKAPVWSLCRTGEPTNLNKQQFVMGSPTSEPLRKQSSPWRESRLSRASHGKKLVNARGFRHKKPHAQDE